MTYCLKMCKKTFYLKLIIFTKLLKQYVFDEFTSSYIYIYIRIQFHVPLYLSIFVYLFIFIMRIKVFNLFVFMQNISILNVNLKNI